VHFAASELRSGRSLREPPESAHLSINSFEVDFVINSFEWDESFPPGSQQ
jgi:hypothetical protein